jgi:hypothetical protein
MATGAEVLAMLIPSGGWAIRGDEFADIDFLECEPITEKQFTDGFESYDAWKAQQDAAKESAKANLLSKLGITAEEAALLLG